MREPTIPDRAALLQELRDLRFGPSPECPRCGCPKVHRHQHFSDRLRFLCTGCKRTFSDFTGSGLAYLKKVELLPAYAQAHLDEKTLRCIAEELGISLGASFRRRIALMRALAKNELAVLAGIVGFADTRMAYSEKGKRNLDRPPRTRGLRSFGRERKCTPRVQVWFAADRNQQIASAKVVGRPLRVADLTKSLLPRVKAAIALAAKARSLSAPARFARRNNVDFHSACPPDNPWSADVQRAVESASEFKRWLRRFRGVATRYLDLYLASHRWVHNTLFGDPAKFTARHLLQSCFASAGRP